MTEPAPRTPLSVEVEDGHLVIRIGIETLAWAAEHSHDFNPFDDNENDFVQLWRVCDALEFAKDVRRALTDEAEDGSSPLTRLLDKMFMEAVGDGSLGIEECAREKRKK
jgi:hypothetical protein